MIKNKNYNKIIGIDFDDCLCINAFPDIQKAEQKWIHKLILWWIKRQQEKGAWIILCTCREDYYYITDKEKETPYLRQAIIYLQNKGFVPNSFNENTPWNIQHYGDCRKISVDLMIDDNNPGLIGWILRYYKNRK